MAKPTFMTRSDIQSVMDDLPDLTRFGFGAYRYGTKSHEEYLADVEREKLLLLDDVGQCNKACTYLQHLRKRKTINRNSGGYGLKHAVEHYMRELDGVENPYVSNGSFICAAYFMGFTVKQISFGPNAYINYSMNSPIIRWRNLAEGSITSTKNTRELNRLEKELGLPKSMAY